MKTVLVTGGTVFVSKYTAAYFAKKDYDVYVLNRNTKTQVEGVTVIQADRYDLGNRLKSLHFDIVLDVTAYNANDISCLVEAIGSFETYIMISSSSVYPDDGAQPFLENSQLGKNKFWGQYGLDKIAAEKRLLELVPKQKRRHYGRLKEN
ncbi:DTDP-glucose 4,6-dehydratase [Streptococcus infantarius subsp. infantarius]|nr:DTDP-glucose 4,6-dehydratase [Streptococcus infantarius subsp. infantarius CJ18]MCO4646411.1 DTDP-glucose 4,6-dehydratase [Streptococcus infantarius subsp. infantarius]MCO4652740.1 DTDP-glucose 4,6-dehydratase [Streptococcus infantarius subsp. infantarius]MCO4654682.1 DTDP-glucose 4,6-dehydratase [Streptococcus infantarius subsp. infantarius]MCO4658234.1 DTDP-glucose 4,6-dehydratase [Streptococcus infantarius subsp. infantarius]